MTAPTGEAAPTEGSAPAPRQRPVRRALDDLGLVVTAEHVDRIAADEPPGSPTTGAPPSRYKALPGESNRLYTPYIDLRAAQLADAALAVDGRRRPNGTSWPRAPTPSPSSSRAATSRSSCPMRRAKPA